MLQLIKPKIIPNLVAESVVNLILERNQLTSLEIYEWSIHQGGKKVLPQSLELFNEYGNFSSASCFFVLKSFFDKYSFQLLNNGLGMIVGFGAGYYLGSSLYRWTSDNFR